MCNINVFKFFALTRTCMHLKVGLNRKRLGKIEHLILTCGLLFFLFDGIYPPLLLLPPPHTHTPCPKPFPEPNLPSELGRSFTPFFTFKEDHFSLFLVKMFLKPIHTRLNKRPSVFLSSFFHFVIVCGQIHIRGPPKSCGAGKNSHLFSDGYYIQGAGEQALKLMEL